MKLQQLLSYTRKAVDEYQMIHPGDKIAVGISGGKDSLTLLYALHGLKRFYPNPFDIQAITVHLGYKDLDLSPISSLCEELSIPYTSVRNGKRKIHARSVRKCGKALLIRRPNASAAIKSLMPITKMILWKLCSFL